MTARNTTADLPVGHRPDAERVAWDCAECRQVTTDPRHSSVDADGIATDRHMDCCAATGCDTCAETVEAHGNVKGDALVAKLTKGK